MTLLAAGNPDQILQTLSNDLMSPYCPGRTIAACPSPQARQLEDHILDQAKSGQSREQIEQALVARFGNDIVGYAPQPVLLYGSALVGLLALVALVMAGRRWSRHSGVGSTATAGGSGTGSSAPTRAELDRLDDALDEVEGF
ncbi:MAG: cytochrome c-type biogenesis protein CcmH [Deltaproteobacteria bacterium]|nr:cytochrome c-type biogenesis protein CcmH [Deltaproteobacteria bacterium]